MADILNRFGFAKEAEAAYKAFIARDLKQPERVLALAQFQARQDRVAEAMAILKNALFDLPPRAGRRRLALALRAPSADETQKRQVEAWVAEAVRKRPEAVVLASKLGAVWIRQGRFDEAEGLLRRLLVSDPDNADALNNLAWLLALRDESRTSEALVLIDRAIEAQGPFPHRHSSRRAHTGRPTR